LGGRNASNAAARQNRLERCRRALELQSSGFTRREIGEAVGVSAESVKALLRDAKFFADPASDEERLQRASAAALAQRQGLTKEQFQVQVNLTGPKVNESWKDADVITALAAEENTVSEVTA
jgi:DNA polymerase-3 subunit epsilon